MSDQLTLAAETRDRGGKGASRELRRQGRVPAVIYGNKQEPVSIHVEERALMKMLMTGHFMNSVVMIDAGKGAPTRTLPKDVAFDVVTDRPIHVDFLRISEHASVHVSVPVVFTDEDAAPGIKKGGVLNVVRHELELVVDAAHIPSEISISLKGLEVGDSIHISNIELPKGAASAIDDRDFTIATLLPPTVPTVEDEAADAEVAEAQAAESAEASADAEAAEEAPAAEGDAE